MTSYFLLNQKRHIDYNIECAFNSIIMSYSGDATESNSRAGWLDVSINAMLAFS